MESLKDKLTNDAHIKRWSDISYDLESSLNSDLMHRIGYEISSLLNGDLRWIMIRWIMRSKMEALMEALMQRNADGIFEI